MRPIFTVTAIFACIAPAALAQTPVADTAREAKETQTAGCVARAAVSKGATLPPVQGVRGSLVAPSAAAASAQVGATNVAGLEAAGASTIDSGLGSSAGGVIGGVDLRNLASTPMTAAAPSASSLGPSSVATVGQAVNGLSGAASALQLNGPSLLAAGAAIGSLSAAQAAWVQNTGARIGGVSIWGQAIQVGSLTLQLQNLTLLQQAARAGGQAQVMTYDPFAAVLVGGAPTIANNSAASPVQLPTYAAVAAALSAAQKAASTSGVAQPLWAGLANPPKDSDAATGSSVASR